MLGPLLFLIYVADIDEELKSARASSFADDTRMVAKVSNDEDRENLQSDLNSIYRWAENNNMTFNSSKFNLMRYGQSSTQQAGYISPENDSIEAVSYLRDLGITMSNTGMFDQHLADCCEKGNQMSGWITRTFSTRESGPMMTLFKAMVRPIIEYCCQIWCPKKQYQINMIESIQRHFTSKIYKLDGLPYIQRLGYLKIYSLERRREGYIIIYTWKIIEGLAPNLLGNDPIELVEYSQRRGRFCRVPSLNTRATAHMRTLKENSFSVNGPRLFNMMPRGLRDHVTSLCSFKRKLDNFLATVVDDPMVVGGNSLLVQVPLERARCVRAEPSLI